MKKISLKGVTISCPVIVALWATILTGSLNAQNTNPIMTARIIHVIPGQVGEYIELQRDHAEARKAAGLPGRRVWQEITGEVNTFHIVTEYENLAALDADRNPPMPDRVHVNWLNRVRSTIQSVEQLTLRVYSDLDIESKKGSEPNLLRLRLVTLEQGQNNAYRTWLAEKFVPMLRKKGHSGRSFRKVMFGENPNTWVIGSQYGSWTEMDVPRFFSELTDEEREEISNDFTFSEAKTKVLRYRADLSYEGP